MSGDSKQTKKTETKMTKFNSYQELWHFINGQVEQYDISCYDVSFDDLCVRMATNLRDILNHRGIEWGDEFEITDSDLCICSEKDFDISLVG